ncbi:hypothetical protein ITX44_07215 [Streptomyces sp. KK5PA1]|uniref:Uncharacterized protein n=1 Tax=Actinacidiphila acididurans TaxID=2784346 RepID=A0ABS2TPA6_9ACTN|nr:hypothetical protein [Actinacidiphila acididurans]
MTEQPKTDTAGPLTVAYAAEPAEVVRLPDAEPGRRPWRAAPQSGRLARTQIGVRGKQVRPALLCDSTEHARRLPEHVPEPAAGYDAAPLADLVRLLPGAAGVSAGAAAE